MCVTLPVREPVGQRCAGGPAAAVVAIVVVGLILAVAPVATGAPAQEDNDRAGEELVAEGRRALEGGRWADAVETLERAVRRTPPPEDAYLYLGLARWRGGRLAAAAEALDEAVERDGSRPLTHLYLGIVRFELRRLPEAREALMRSRRLDPENPVVHVALARVYVNLMQFDAAAASLARAEELDPDSAAVHTAKGLLAYRRGDLRRAEEALKRALEIDPQDREARLLRADVALQRGEPSRAATAAEKVLELEPTRARAHYLLAEAYAAMGRGAEADARRRAFRLLGGEPGGGASEHAASSGVAVDGGLDGGDPARSPGRSGREAAVELLREAEAARAEGFLAEAEALAEAAAEIDPSTERVSRRTLALIQYDRGYFDRAADLLEEVRQAAPANEAVVHDLALAYLQGRRPERAVKLLKPFLEGLEEGDDAGLRHLLAVAALEVDDAGLALSAASRATELEPEVARHHLVRSRALERLGRTEEAERARRRYEALRELE